MVYITGESSTIWWFASTLRILCTPCAPAQAEP